MHTRSQNRRVCQCPTSVLSLTPIRGEQSNK
ncbi:hypothetical protein E2C01_087103 [Portunus trituberculatus]|uniref:Uncharacterized protein n=1 Tax=Portunus trituberculatus TaxID=210409 RepID=A0A5B7JCF8_PORTR|nr:hypothetical protein [Portunus trituberculatus]